MHREQLGVADDEHDRGILDVDDQVVADLRDDVADGLGQDDAGHGLEVIHADGLRAFGLAGVDGHDAAANGLRHVRAGVDGDYQIGRRGHVQPGAVAEEVGKAEEDEHRLQDHGRAAEDLHVDADDRADHRQQHLFDRVVVLGVGDRLQDAAGKADEAPHRRGGHGQQDGLSRAGQVLGIAARPGGGNVLDELG